MFKDLLRLYTLGQKLMSQYGRVNPTYYNPIAKFNTTRQVIRYYTLVYSMENRIFNFCRYLIQVNATQYHLDSHPFTFGEISSDCQMTMPPNPIQYLLDSYPFTFAFITDFCNYSSNLPVPIEYSDYSISVIPIDTSVTGSCNVDIIADQIQLNKDVGSITPEPFSFGTVTGFCTSSLVEGTPLDYTPLSPPTELVGGLFGEVISSFCSYQMPSNPFDYYITPTPFNFVSINNFCNYSSNLPVPIEYSDYSISVIPIDTSVTGSCNVDIIADQIQLNKDAGSIIPEPFSFGAVTGNCLNQIEFSDLDDFNLTIGQHIPQTFNFDTIDNSCVANIV